MVNEIFGIERNRNVGWKNVPIILDILVGLLYSVVLEWWFSKEQSIHDNPNRPDINLITVTLLFQYLWSNIVRCPTDSLLAVSLVFYPGA